jgi:hypothetical protein
MTPQTPGKQALRRVLAAVRTWLYYITLSEHSTSIDVSFVVAGLEITAQVRQELERCEYGKDLLQDGVLALPSGTEGIVHDALFTLWRLCYPGAIAARLRDLEDEDEGPELPAAAPGPDKISPDPDLRGDLDQARLAIEVFLEMLPESEDEEDERPESPTPDYCLQPPNQARWEQTTDLPPQLYQLLKVLLTYGTWPIPFDAVEGVVGDRGRNVSNAVSRLNQALEPTRFPWTFHTKAAFIKKQ